MFTAMYLLLNLTPLTYSLSSAKKNYLEIMSAIHPDKCSSPMAVKLTQAVVQAYRVLTNHEKRLYYNLYGNPEPNVEYDNSQATEYSFMVNQLLGEYRQKIEKKEQERQRVLREKQRLKSKFEDGSISKEEYYTALNNLTPCQEPESNATPYQSSFDSFLNKCQEAANKRGSNSTNANQSEAATNNASSENPQSEKQFNEQEPTANSASASSDRQQQEEDPNIEVIDLSSDDDEDTVIGQESDEDNIQIEQSPKFKDMATSPIKFGEFKDAASSPILTTCDASTSPLKTSQTYNAEPESPAAKRNLNFGGQTSTPKASTTNTTNEPENDPSTTKDEASATEEVNNESSFGENARPSTSATSVHKQFISKVYSYRMRKNADGTSCCRFKVRWGPGGYDVVESAEVLIKEKVGLRNWLDLLQVNQQKRYNSIISFHPEFLNVYKD